MDDMVAAETYLNPGRFVDLDHPAVRAYAAEHVGDAADTKGKVLNLFYAIRDGIYYDPYLPPTDPRSYMASVAVETGRGWCVPKAALMAACCRIHGIPARPGYADVINHLATDKLLEALGDDVFYWHSYCDVFMGEKWVKCTPAFNKSMCEKFGLKPLDFDGETDSLFHEFDQAGNKHMEYLRDRGTYADVPMDEIIATFKANYRADWLTGLEGDFQEEAGQPAA